MCELTVDVMIASFEYTCKDLDSAIAAKQIEIGQAQKEFDNLNKELEYNMLIVKGLNGLCKHKSTTETITFVVE